jgi:hypothetical protein
MLKLEGKDVGALFQLPAEMTAMGIPPNWLSYVSIASADDTAAKAKSLGGTLMKGPCDVMTAGRMAVIKDPTGAAFAIWQAGAHNGASAINTPNAACWNELMTADSAKAGDFYTGLFGWTKNVMSMGPMEYTIFENGGERGAGGMFTITPEMGPIPPHWLVYFAVDDCDRMAEKVTELGGSVIKPAEDIPGIGRFAILMDPQGTAFAFIKPEPM